MTHFGPVEHHIEDRAHARLCDSRPTSDVDISSSDWGALRDARKDATLCPDCQDRVPSRDVRSELYGYDRMSTAHLYSVPVLAAFDAIRNCSHCRRDTDDNCKAWREARKAVAVLTQKQGGLRRVLTSCGRQRVAGWRTSTSSRTERTLPRPSESSMSGVLLVGCRVDYEFAALLGACGVSIPTMRGTGIPLAESQVLYGDSAETVLPTSTRKTFLTTEELAEAVSLQ